MNPVRVHRGRLPVLLLIAGFLAGCQKTSQPVEPPPPLVGVVESRRMDVPVLSTPIGTTRALEEVSIRARVRGFLQERHFEEGSFVKKGQLLLVIDEAPFKVALDSAKAKQAEAEATLAKAQKSMAREVATAKLALNRAQLLLAQVEEKRARALLTKNAGSREDFDRAEADRKKAEAQIDSDNADLDQSKSDYDVNILSAKARLEDAKANVRNAELDLGYCRMYAPFDGRIGEAKIKVGNLVGPVSAEGLDMTALATIQQLDPMGVDVEVSSRYLERATRLISEGKAAIRITRQELDGFQEYPHTGQCYFIDNTIDPTTSTFLVRARIPNPDSTLLPGEYVKLRVIVNQLKDAVVVPEQAVMETQAGPVVYLVDKDNKVAVQRVDAAQTYEGIRVVTTGLEAGVPVIVEGIQLVRPGIVVKSEPAQLARQIERPLPDTRKAPGKPATKPEPVKETESEKLKALQGILKGDLPEQPIEPAPKTEPKQGEPKK